MNIQLLKLSLVGLAIGAAVGIGMFTFVYAKGYSYLSNDAASCANCHVMNDQYNAWLKSSHKNVASCNDCHTPHDSIVGKYYTKASNGFWHSYYFTFNNFHEPIQITERNRQVTESSCRHCHQDLTDSITAHAAGRAEEEISCIRCHRSVGHMH